MRVCTWEQFLEKMMSEKNTITLSRYYKFHSKIYDATRWTFLFGRSEIVRKIKMNGDVTRVGEIGCGTGINTKYLAAKFPNAHIDGFDLAAPMITLAAKKFERADNVTFHCKPYEKAEESPRYDVILASYSLSMINPGFDTVIKHASTDIKSGGKFAVVDFYFSPISMFRKWMGVNHVRMEKHLLPELENHFATEIFEQRSAYFGLWNYILWIGSPRP